MSDKRSAVGIFYKKSLLFNLLIHRMRLQKRRFNIRNDMNIIILKIFNKLLGVGELIGIPIKHTAFTVNRGIA